MKNIVVDGSVIYACKCGCKVLFNLDSRLKLGSTTNGKEWQPIPFMLKCPRCKDLTLYHTHWHLDEKFPPRDLKKGESYFEYDDSGEEMACGIPHIKERLR